MIKEREGEEGEEREEGEEGGKRERSVVDEC